MNVAFFKDFVQITGPLRKNSECMVLLKFPSIIAEEERCLHEIKFLRYRLDYIRHVTFALRVITTCFLIATLVN